MNKYEYRLISILTQETRARCEANTLNEALRLICGSRDRPYIITHSCGCHWPHKGGFGFVVDQIIGNTYGIIWKEIEES